MFKKLNFIQKILFFFQSLVLFAAILSYLAPYTKPTFLWPIAFLGLAFPLLFLLQLILCLFWFFVQRKIALICFVVLLAGIPQFLSNYSLFKSEKKSTDAIKIISFNVKVFDLYNWKNNKKSIQQFKDYLNHENADIICFQEFFSDDENLYVNDKELMKELKYKYSAIHYTKRLHDTQNWGIAIFSKHKIIKKDVIRFENKANNAAQFADIVIKEDTIRVYNTHLQSVHFSENDYEVVEKITNEHEAELKGSRKIVSRLKKAFLKRERQATLLKNSMNASPYRLIVCGDFNDPPNSYAYKHVSKNLQDAFLEAGSGWGSTYNGKIPYLRIDYIFTDKTFSISNFRVGYDFELSDHFPVITDIAISNN